MSAQSNEQLLQNLKTVKPFLRDLTDLELCDYVSVRFDFESEIIRNIFDCALAIALIEGNDYSNAKIVAFDRVIASCEKAISAKAENKIHGAVSSNKE